MTIVPKKKITTTTASADQSSRSTNKPNVGVPKQTNANNNPINSNNPNTNDEDHHNKQQVGVGQNVVVVGDHEPRQTQNNGEPPPLPSQRHLQHHQCSSVVAANDACRHHAVVVDHHSRHHHTVVDPDGDYSGYNSGDEHTHDRGPSYMQWSEQEFQEKEILFEKMINKKGWVIKKMEEDGACLFRAVADQIYGDQEMHGVLRKLCIDYIAKNSDYFSQYVTEDFGEYLKRKSLEHSHGNHIEIQAMSEMFNRPIEVYHYSSEPINTFQGAKNESEPIRLSYHRSVHYNSIVNPYKPTVGVGLGLPSLAPGEADRSMVEKAIKMSEEDAIEKAMLEDKLLASDWEATNNAIEEQVARESYLEWLRENESRMHKKFKTDSSSTTTTTTNRSTIITTATTETTTNQNNNQNQRESSSSVCDEDDNRRKEQTTTNSSDHDPKACTSRSLY